MILKNISDKVLFVGPSIYSNGGVSLLLHFYSINLKSFNHIVTYKDSNKLSQFGIAFIGIFQLLNYLLFKNVEIIHIHSSSQNSFFRKSIYLLISKIFNKTVILHLHGGAFKSFYDIYPRYTRFICKKADCLIGVSTNFCDLLKKLDLNENIYLLHNMIELPTLKKKKCSRDKLKVLFLGSIDNNKGIFDVLSCIINHKEYVKEHFVFHICGRGDYKRLNNIIESNDLNDIVFYHGWINKEEKNVMLSDTDIYIQPSYFESFGISILEAMQYGIPIIASNTGGITDLVTDGENGFLINPGDMDLFFICLIKFIENKDLLDKMGYDSYTKSKMFSQEIIQNKLLNIYTKLLDSK